MALDSVLEPTTLRSLYTRFGGVVNDPFAPYFPATNNKQPGDKVGIEVYDYSRKLATVNLRGADPIKVKPPLVTLQTATALTISESITLEPRVVKDLRGPGELTRTNGREEVARRILELRQRNDRRKVSLHSQAIKGTLSFTLPGGVTQTVSMGMRATHTPASIAASWATAGTDIIGQLMDWRVLVIADTGINPTRLYLNTTTSKYLLTNTAIKAFWSGLPMAQNILATGQLPPIAGYSVEVVDDGYISDAGVWTPYIADNEVVLGPAPGLATSSDVECQPVSLMAPEGAYGIFFNTIEPEPGVAHINEGITVEYEYTYLPTLGAEPDAFVYIADVTDTTP